MSATARPCPTCKGETNLHVIDSTSGEEHPLAVTVRGLTVQRCGKDHIHFVSRDFPMTLLHHLVDEDEAKLPAADRKGLIFKHFHCHDCRQELAPKPDHRHTFGVVMDLGVVPSFAIDLVMPVYKCPGCGKEQLHTREDVRKHTAPALANAFQAAGILREA